MPATTTTTKSRQRVFTLRFMAGVAYVASPIPRLISLEVVEALRPALGQRSNVTVMRIKAVVNMAVKAVTAVKPGAGSNKYPTNKPVGPIVPVRSTVIRSIVEVPVRAHGCHSDIYADGNLSWRHRYTAQKPSHESCESKRTDFEHNLSFFLLIRTEVQPAQLSASIIPTIGTGKSLRKVIATGSQLGNCRSDCC
jgi:hypothetical protein